MEKEDVDKLVGDSFNPKPHAADGAEPPLASRWDTQRRSTRTSDPREASEQRHKILQPRNAGA